MKTKSMPVPGALKPSEFDKLPKKTNLWLVWSSSGLDKREKNTLALYNKGKYWWGKDTLRRAFTNYFHAYAYCLKTHGGLRPYD